jgi:hypothetical protein
VCVFCCVVLELRVIVGVIFLCSVFGERERARIRVSCEKILSFNDFFRMFLFY